MRWSECGTITLRSQDLEFELELVVHAVGKMIVFVDNQVLIHCLFPSFRLINFF